MISLFLLTGCATSRKASTSSEKVRTEYIHQIDTLLRHDSIHVHDSVFVAQRGDTFFQYKWRTEYRDRIVYRTHNDTVNNTDTITLVVTETTQVATPQSFFQRITSVIGTLALCLLAAAAITIIIRRFIK